MAQSISPHIVVAVDTESAGGGADTGYAVGYVRAGDTFGTIWSKVVENTITVVAVGGIHTIVAFRTT